MTAFVLIGTGWRADFFHRIAKELPQQFAISAVITRTQKRAREVSDRWGVYATADWDDGLARAHDFVVLCIRRTAAAEYLKRLWEAGEAVLCETPPGYSAEDFARVWEYSKAYRAKIQICEQYQFWPLYASCLELIKDGRLGSISNVSLSALHGYHAVSLFRRCLGLKWENCRIAGRSYAFDVTATLSRDGYDTSGNVIRAKRDMAALEFENGRCAFLDFSDEQYFSPIRTRRMNIQGTRGEINDLTVRFLNSKNRPVTLDFARKDDGVYQISGWSHQGIMLGEEFLYRNPFPGAKLNDDEIAVATCLERMKEYTDGGKEFYGLAEGLQDAYLSLKMEEAAANPGMVIDTVRQPWSR